MSTNKVARQKLEAIYGKGCMFKKAHIPEQIENLKTIKTYKRFLQETRYSGRKIRLLEKNMTYHHLRHVSEGGKATDENGAVVNELAHRYLHSLPRDEEEVVNNMLRQYKLKIDGGIMTATDEGLKIEQPFAVDIEMDLNDCIVIPAHDITAEDMKKREKFNRAKVKRETQQLIEEDLYYDDDYER